MGLCISREERELRNRSAAIDRVIEEDAKKMRKECKILLLGNTFDFFFLVFFWLDIKENTELATNTNISIIKNRKR